MLGSLGYDWGGLVDKVVGATANIQLAKTQAEIEAEKAKQARAMAAAARGAGAPAVSNATKIGLTIGIPAVILLGVALFLKGRK